MCVNIRGVAFSVLIISEALAVQYFRYIIKENISRKAQRYLSVYLGAFLTVNTFISYNL